VKVEDKYSQADVVAFWSRFAQSGLQRAEALMLERYAPPAPARVLDLGCGPGRVTLALVPLGYDVIGLDVTPAMLQAARSSSTAVRGQFVQADLRQLPFACESFEVALVFIAALQHVARRAQRQSALRQIASVLTPPGVLILALDNIAPALTCYATWAMQRLLPAASRGTGTPGMLCIPGVPSADRLLESNRSHSNALSWHARGLARTLRWRTWEGLRDLGRSLRLSGGEAGDTFIKQVALLPTAGKVYYHLYNHQELMADAQVAGLRLVGYHSARELAEGKEFGQRARRLDKQVLYAFTKT